MLVILTHIVLFKNKACLGIQRLDEVNLLGFFETNEELKTVKACSKKKKKRTERKDFPKNVGLC